MLITVKNESRKGNRSKRDAEVAVLSFSLVPRKLRLESSTVRHRQLHSSRRIEYVG